MQVPLLVWNIRCTFRLEKLCDILFTTRLHNTIVRQANQGESGGLPATPPRWSGFRLCFIPNPAFRRVAAPRWAMILSPLRAQVSARLRLAKFQFVVESKQYSLIAEAISPAHRRGSDFRSPTAHQLLDKFQFSGQMPDMLPAACDSLENAACVHE